MGSRRRAWTLSFCLLGLAHAAEAQWRDPKLIAGQIGFNVAASFFGKMLLGHEPAGRALKQALCEGSVSGLVAHAGYSITGRHPEWALLGKLLAQKSTLTTRRSFEGLPVFDETLYTHWEITHSFLHVKWDGKPRVEIDAVNAAFSSYFLFAGEPYRFDAKRSLLSGSLVFWNSSPPEPLHGYYVPGALWIDAGREDERRIWAHELVHSLQLERGAAISEWQFAVFRINWLGFVSGVPALMAGWPEHDTRFHEIEAIRYSGGH